ncbi:60S ribosomal subunit assembly/export protein loc-like protein [Hapsidospora chrysogenum ATCC 11550]|uniref:60S ribosomal subunit assembly/export protein loc-like protein n=1 Tax=Hapsidospora chrysogenum (strain ATCC 11550 / CBS 779.69 / DSM 880 / IAM 14645 / JCM 23072 / IMI 49137) TaxID=857340 RepID=A0A086TE55_HAPC1|nr:60S ribosomal subunit assembly/export protein loc-like protein [Hapsidospora chrysogenum ATCC 11550]
MAPSRTRTVKNKHAAPKSSDSGSGRKSSTGGVSKPRKPGKPGPVSAVQLKEKNRAALLKKPKKKTYTDEELGIPKLNMITPVGVTKPKGKKKGKVFVDDKEGMTTIMSMVQAEKEGQIESKMIKARQMEEIREARRVEAEKKESEKKSKLENVKESLRKKRKRKDVEKGNDDDSNIKDMTSAGTKAGGSAGKKKKKSVSFA